MIRRRGFKYFFAALGLCAFFAAGYVTTSALTSCPARAIICCQGIGLMNTEGGCLGLFTGITPPLGEITAAVTLPGIAYVMISAGVYYAAVMTEFMVKVYQQIGLNINHWLDWWNTLWYYNFNPALQDMARQLAVLDADQARAIGSFNDMLMRGGTVGKRSDRDIASHVAQRPGENVCVAGSLSGGMVQADTFTDAYNAAAGADMLVRTGNMAGTPAAAGTLAENNARYGNYVTRYCDPNENAGVNDCTAPAPFAGLDRDVTGQVFQKETIDLKDPDTKQIVDDLVTNIAEPLVRDPVPYTASGSAEGQEIVLRNEAYKAQRQVVFDALYHVVARRAPTSSLAGFTVPVHEAAGVPIVMRKTKEAEEEAVADAGGGLLSVRRARAQPVATPLPPSKNEVMNVISSERAATGDFAARQVDEPANNAREAVVQEGVRLRQLNDMLDLVDRYSLIVAGQVGYRLNQERPADARMSQQPMQ
jgi:hypothetical protein